MHIDWPQGILIGLLIFTGAYKLLAHGSWQGRHNFFAWAFDAAILLGLLYWGGFFE